MALQYHVTGPALVKVGTGEGNPPALETLGYARDGILIRNDAHWADVYADSAGGEAGIPVESFYLSEREIVRMELTKWDQEVANKILARFREARPGLGVHVGVAVWASGKGTIRLVAETDAEPRRWPCAVLREAIELNKGTRASRLVLQWECYADQIAGSPTENYLYDDNPT